MAQPDPVYTASQAMNRQVMNQTAMITSNPTSMKTMDNVELPLTHVYKAKQFFCTGIL